MRKIILSILVCFITLVSMAQKPAVITGNHLIYDKAQGKETVTVIIFDSITSATSIQYDGTDVKWYNFTDSINPISTFKYYSPEDATGYIIRVDGKQDTIWVIDYNKHKAVFKSFIAENNPKDQCKEVKLLIDADIPQLNYYTPDSGPFPLTRNFTISYGNEKWNANTIKWDTFTTTDTLTLPATYFSVEAPLIDTYFTLSGDQYGDALNMTKSITSTKYSAVAVECHITYITDYRTEKNENERPSKTSISGSAPLDILFSSNANVPVTKYYKWEIYKDKALWNSRQGLDTEQRYTFTDKGSYNLKLTVSNDYCSYTDSTITITVVESWIKAPNVFTPNGDGSNDEFRVAYKSILSFECWVYSRWGRLVYHWTDPQRGWDGTINGRKATPGPYFYVIKAKGSDYDPNSAVNKSTKLRAGEYLLKGDINLLRGK
jgi:gliding motility-associated-like protein